MRRAIAAIVVIALLILAVPSASAQFGDILRRGKQATDKAKKAKEAFEAWTPEQEKAIGEASAAKLIHIFGLFDNAEMTQYVNLVGNAVAQHSPRYGELEYKFGVLDTDSINAFAMPGGYVFVSRGALANMKSEAELAGTLAHEIAHVDNKHLEKQLRAKKVTGFGMEEVGSRLPGPQLLKDLANKIVTEAVTTAYSRDKEAESDSKGTELSVTAGYDAGGLKNFLTALKSAKEAAPDAGKRHLGLWGTTHPPLEQRISDLTAQAAKFESAQELPDRFTNFVCFEPCQEEKARLEAERAAKAQADRLAAEAAKRKAARKAKKTAPK